MLETTRMTRSTPGEGDHDREGVMSEADQLRQYAEEALHWASQAKSEKEQRVLRELARTWSQAALASESIVWWSTTVRQSTGPLSWCGRLRERRQPTVY
jgi:hypothetical protein